MIETYNAKIKSTTLGPEDHGILTCMLHLEFGGYGQGFGGHDLRRAGAAAQWITQILAVVGVAKWEELPGKLCRVETEGHKLIRLIHIMDDDRWFKP